MVGQDHEAVNPHSVAALGTADDSDDQVIDPPAGAQQ
jgi:hypothetical protein